MSQTMTRFTGLSQDKAARLAAILGEDLIIETDAVSSEEISSNRWRVDAYTASPPDEGALEALLSVADVGNVDVVSEPVPDIDWVAEGLKSLQPVEAGRFLVHGSHTAPVASPGQIALRVDAGQAFGTGHHGTTAGCLQALSDLEKQGYRADRVLDLGTGSGVLAIAAARLFRCRVIGTDLDADSVPIAHQNARDNGVGPRVHVHRTTRASIQPIRDGRHYDLIFANILAKLLIGLAPQITEIASPGTVLIVSGLLSHQTGPVRAAYAARRFRFDRLYRRDGWATIIFSRLGQ